jgi:hypothetical protein
VYFQGGGGVFCMVNWNEISCSVFQSGMPVSPRMTEEIHNEPKSERIASAPSEIQTVYLPDTVRRIKPA